MKRLRKERKSLKFEWVEAGDIKKRARMLVKTLGIPAIKLNQIFFYRSQGSKSRAYARTWGLPRLWQDALKVKPAYIIEVISKHFDHLSPRDKDKVILHELSHIPSTFSGALLPHTRHKKGSFHHKLDEIISKYFENF